MTYFLSLLSLRVLRCLGTAATKRLRSCVAMLLCFATQSLQVAVGLPNDVF